MVHIQTTSPSRGWLVPISKQGCVVQVVDGLDLGAVHVPWGEVSRVPPSNLAGRESIHSMEYTHAWCQTGASVPEAAPWKRLRALPKLFLRSLLWSSSGLGAHTHEANESVFIATVVPDFTIPYHRA